MQALSKLATNPEWVLYLMKRYARPTPTHERKPAHRNKYKPYLAGHTATVTATVTEHPR